MPNRSGGLANRYVPYHSSAFASTLFSISPQLWTPHILRIAARDHFGLPSSFGGRRPGEAMDIPVIFLRPPLAVTTHCLSSVSAVWQGRDNNDAGRFRKIRSGAPQSLRACAPQRNTGAASPAAQATNLREPSGAPFSRSGLRGFRRRTARREGAFQPWRSRSLLPSSKNSGAPDPAAWKTRVGSTFG